MVHNYIILYNLVCVTVDILKGRGRIIYYLSHYIMEEDMHVCAQASVCVLACLCVCNSIQRHFQCHFRHIMMVNNQIIIILRRSMLSIRLDRPGKHVLIFPRVFTMPSLCNHSVRHPLHQESVFTSVPVSHIHWSPIQVLTVLEVA